jgi:ketosteroid isomerase-like protein
MSDAPEATYLGGDQNLYGVDAMREPWTDWAANLSRQEFRYTESRTFILAPDIAFTIRNVAGVATRKDGSIRPEMESVESAVWVKRDGEWKILFGHESALPKSWQLILESESDQ